jgi:hypothetical protein
MNTDSFAFELQRSIAFDLECYPGRWCVGFFGPGSNGTMTTKIVEDRDGLVRILQYFANTGRTVVGYNSERFDVPLIQGILDGIDPYAPAQSIIENDKLPPALTNLPELPCDHVDLSARLRRSGRFPSLKQVAAYLGRPTLRELPYRPDAVLSDEQWDEVKQYNRIDLGHTWALLERLAPELQALAELSREQGQDLRSVSSPQVVSRVFLSAYRDAHGHDPITTEGWTEVSYHPVPGIVRPHTADAADWFDRITSQPMLMVSRGARRKPNVPNGRFKIGDLTLSVGAGGLHSVDRAGVYYSTRKRVLLSVDVASFYPALVARKRIGPAAFGNTGRETYRSLLRRRLTVKRAAKKTEDPAERDRLTAQADGLKLVLNSFVGKTADPYSTLYDPGAFLAVTLSGQLMLIDLIERLTEAGVKVISANTDGLFLHVPRKHRTWREILKRWQADSEMRLDVEPLRRLAILASNQYATRDRTDKVKRKGGELRGALDWTHSPNSPVLGDAVANALLFDVPPERTIFDCRELVRFCSIATRGTAADLVLVDGDAETKLPKVTRWYRSKEGSRRIERRFLDGRQVTVPGAQSVTIRQDLPESGLPADLDWSWYLREARRIVQKVPGYRHRSRRRLLDHGPALDVASAGLLPVPKHGKAQPVGSDVKRPTLLWDWPSCPTIGCYTGPSVGTLVVDVDDPAKFHKFVETGDSLFEPRWKTLDGALVSCHGDAAPDDVRGGRQKGKLIFRLDGDDNHPLGKVKSRWKERRGIEVFYGNGLPSVLGDYDGNGDRYRLDGTLGDAPDWLVVALTPKPTRSRQKTPAMAPAAREAALEGLPAVLAELSPALGQSCIGWRRKDVQDGREIWVGRCPFEHDSGRSEDGDLDAGYHDDGPYIRCLHGSCAQVQEINRRLRERHEQEHPAEQAAPHPPWSCAAESPEVTEPAELHSDDDPGPEPPPAGFIPAAPVDANNESQAQTLLRLANRAELWHTPDGRAYVTLIVSGHREHHAVTSSGMHRWLRHAYYVSCGKPPAAEAMQGAIGVLEARAIFEGPEIQAHVRAGEVNGVCYLDLCDDRWRSVAIGPDGWKIVSRPPARFRRPSGLQALPEPQREGSLELLRKHVNVQGDEFRLLVAWLAEALRSTGPYPVLALTGEQGSAKTRWPESRACSAIRTSAR